MAERRETKVPNFGPTLKALRERDPALSQGKLAERAGLDHSTVGRYEAGTRDPTTDVVERLADALGLAPTERDKLRDAAGFRTESIAFRLNLPALAKLDERYATMNAQKKRTIVFLVDFLLDEFDTTVRHPAEGVKDTFRTDTIVSEIRATAYEATPA